MRNPSLPSPGVTEIGECDALDPSFSGGISLNLDIFLSDINLSCSKIIYSVIKSDVVLLFHKLSKTLHYNRRILFCISHVVLNYLSTNIEKFNFSQFKVIFYVKKTDGCQFTNTKVLHMP